LPEMDIGFICSSLPGWKVHIQSILLYGELMNVSSQSETGTVLWALMCIACLLMSQSTQAGSPELAPRAFVSSASGNGNFSTWEDATPDTSGLEAADSICSNLASAAGLTEPGSYVAWVSDSNDDAYCRVAGFSGKMTANCGQGALPVNTGPWVRTDLLPWAGQIGQLNSPDLLVYTPLNLDESGQQVAAGTTTWTATYNGQLGSSAHCDGWTTTTTAATDIYLGSVDHTGAAWSYWSISKSCLVNRHLYCMKSEVFGPIDLPTPAGGQIAFVTSAHESGDLGSWPEAEVDATGLAAGDSICNAIATTEGLDFAGHYKAWLSDADTDARDRFRTDGPWNRLDGFEVAANQADLTDGTLFTSINLTEQGNYLGNIKVWTGTAPDGTALPDHCNSWQSTGGNGEYGTAIGTVTLWTRYPVMSACSTTNGHLYCLSDYDPNYVFDDGYE